MKDDLEVAGEAEQKPAKDAPLHNEPIEPPHEKVLGSSGGVTSHCNPVVRHKQCFLPLLTLFLGASTACVSLGSRSEDGESGIAASEGTGRSEDGHGPSEDSDDPTDEDGETESSPPGDTDSGDSEDGETSDAPVLPAGIRRLTNAEYIASIRALFGVALPEDTDLPPDALQDGFSRNQAQRVDPVLAKQLDRNAIWVAERVRESIDTFAPCSGDASACAQDFIERTGAAAYRRPLTLDEVNGYLALYAAGSEGATHADGIALVVRGLLQSSGFLYITELGDPEDTGEMRRLTNHELAASISYLALAEPPDAELTQAAEAGLLEDPVVRVEQLDRLLQRDGSGNSAVLRILLEWLGIGNISQIAKDSQVYPQFESLRRSMHDEALAFITTVLQEQGTLQQLLGADWTIADQALSQAYGVSGEGQVSLATTPRRGILNQAAFLAVFAHAQESAPILRGVAVLRRMLCYPTPSPTTLDLMVVPPLPDPSKTTRERFEIHSADPACAACHRSIDNVGFSFEGFDGMGMSRPGGMENGQPVDSATDLQIGVDVDGAYAHSGELALALAASEDVRTCFARHLFRASATRSDGASKAAENAFIEAWSADPGASQGHILDTLRAYVASEGFVLRRHQ